MQSFRAPSNDQSIFSARAPQGNALMSAGAATRTGSRARDANGACRVPVIVPVRSIAREEPSVGKSMYPIWQRKDGLSYTSPGTLDPVLLASDPVAMDRDANRSAHASGAQLTTAETNYVFYGMCVGISPHGQNRLSGGGRGADFKRFDVCVRGVYDAPHNWLWKWTTKSDNDSKLEPYAFNCGTLLMDMKRDIIFVQGLHEAIGNDEVILGRFYNHVSDWTQITNKVTRTQSIHRVICRNSAMESATSARALTSRERRANKRTFKVFLRT